MGSLWKSALGLASAAVVSVGLGACSSTSHSSAANQASNSGTKSTSPGSQASGGTCQQQFSSSLSLAEKVPGFTMPGAVNGSALRGKLVVAVPEDLSIPDDSIWLAGVKQAASVVGARIQVIDGGGTTSGESNAIEQAITLKPAAILIWGVTETSVSGAVSALQSSHIPWDNVYDNTGNGKYLISVNWPDIGKLEADYVLSQTNCKPDSVVFTSSVFSTSIVPEVNAYKAEITRVCPSCSTNTVDVPPTDIATKLQPDTVAALLKDPNINYFLAGYDGEASYIAAGIQQEGKHVPIIGNTGTSSNVKAVASGQPQVADVEHVSDGELAFASFDDVFRQIAGQPAASDWYPLPNILITPSNVQAAQSHLDSTGYVAQFRQTWGLGG